MLSNWENSCEMLSKTLFYYIFNQLRHIGLAYICFLRNCSYEVFNTQATNSKLFNFQLQKLCTLRH